MTWWFGEKKIINSHAKALRISADNFTFYFLNKLKNFAAWRLGEKKLKNITLRREGLVLIILHFIS
jgi:hypothetical protein